MFPLACKSLKVNLLCDIYLIPGNWFGSKNQGIINKFENMTVIHVGKDLLIIFQLHSVCL